MKFVDCFTFNNELDLLQYRLALLNDFVDHFILIESNTTQSGHSKPTHYNDNKQLFEKYHSKIIHMVVDLPYKVPNIDHSKNQQWINENIQRNCIKECVQSSHLGLCKEDLLIISDLDEIIDPQRLVAFRDGSLKAYKGYSLLQDMYYYNLQCKQKCGWTKAKIVSYNHFLQTTPEEIRQSELPLLERCGWHLSYFGDVAFIRNKLKVCAHQEFNTTEYNDEKKIVSRMERGVDLFDREYNEFEHVSLNENTYLPPLYDVYLNKYIRNDKTSV